MESSKSYSASSPCLFFLLIFSLVVVVAAAGKSRVSIPDDLSDVVDDEEDEEWKKWGQMRTRSGDILPPPDFSRMNPDQIQAEMMKRHTAPSFGFVKLRPGSSRSREDVPVIAMKWSNVIRTGSLEARFMAVDRHTIMFTMEKGQELKELKEFVLSQPEAYEMKIGEQLFRRPGDPPLDVVIEKLNKERSVNDMNHVDDEL
ncbi:hypothetical protein KSP39_PZI013279 [Platanthera zijinensis]|uniref:Mesoderm development candidate 2 n=1 Tax=Platanthera zijinensis TaxID=2320716 RepID=A0AAP0G342_9ASPA